MTLINGVDYGYISDAQTRICAAIDAYRDRILYDKFIWNDKRWDCDQISRQNITGACTFVTLNGGLTPPGFVWRDYDNNNWSMSGIDMAQLGGALLAFTFAAYQVAWTHKSNVIAITDPNHILDVINYDFTAGWILASLTFSIIAVDISNSKFTIGGNVTEMFSPAAGFNVSGSTGNDGGYTVANASFDNLSPSSTTITIVETIADATVDGSIILA